MPATLMSRSGFDNLKFFNTDATDATKICHDKILSFGFIEAILVCWLEINNQGRGLDIGLTVKKLCLLWSHFRKMKIL